MGSKKKEKQEKENENLADLLKKLAFGSIGAVSVTQEAVYKLVNSIVQQIDKNKDEIINAIAAQFGAALKEVDVTKLMRKLINGLTIKVKAEVTLTYKKGDKE